MTKQTRNIAEVLVQIGTQFGSVLWQRAYWYDRMTLAHAALHAAKLISDWKSVSTFARNISWIYLYQGDYLRALHWAEESLSATNQTEDELLIAAAKRSLGTVELHLGHFDRSENLLQDVLRTSEKFASDDYGIYSKGFAQYGLGELEYERSNIKAAKDWYQKALDTWQDPVRKDPVRHISYALNGLGFVALKEKRYEDAKRFFTAGIQSAEEFGRVDELARGQLGLASVYFETCTDLRTALELANESIDSFQQQGMQYQIQKAKTLQEEILKAHPQILTSQLQNG